MIGGVPHHLVVSRYSNISQHFSIRTPGRGVIFLRIGGYLQKGFSLVGIVGGDDPDIGIGIAVRIVGAITDKGNGFPIRRKLWTAFARWNIRQLRRRAASGWHGPEITGPSKRESFAVGRQSW